MDNKAKRLPTFKEFCNGQNEHKKLKENVNIEVEWWDQCIVEVLQDLKDECGGHLSELLLSQYIKNKFSILGREWDEYNDNIYIMHIKDLIWTHHGDSLCLGCDEEGNKAVHTKGVVIEELSSEIFRRLMMMANSPLADDSPNAVLADKENVTLVPMKEVPDSPDEDCEDECCESRKVKGFQEYSVRKLKENEERIDCDCYDECVDYCLATITREAGSHNPDDIIQVAVQAVDGKIKARLTLLYVQDMVLSFLQQKGMVLIAGTAGDNASNDSLTDLCHQIADDVLLKIANENGVFYEEAE